MRSRVKSIDGNETRLSGFFDGYFTITSGKDAIALRHPYRFAISKPASAFEY